MSHLRPTSNELAAILRVAANQLSIIALPKGSVALEMRTNALAMIRDVARELDTVTTAAPDPDATGANA